MRFSTTQKLATHSLVGATLLTLALAGVLPTTWLAVAAALSLASWFCEPERHAALGFLRSWTWSVALALLMLAAFTATALAVAHGAPSLPSGARCLAALLLAKLYHRRAAGDELQLCVLCFLALATCAALDPGPGFALGLVACTACGAWALALLHLRREIEGNHLGNPLQPDESARVARAMGSRRIVDRSFIVAAAALAVGALAAAALLFPLLPRLGGLLSPRRGHSLTIGFDDRGVELGRNGLPTATDDVVMRVEFPEGRPRGPLYFRGASFCDYSGGRWTAHPAARLPLRRVEGHALVGVPVLPGATLGATAAAGDPVHGALPQTIYLEPLGTTALFAVSAPVAFALPSSAGADLSTSLLGGTWIDPTLRRPTGDVYLPARRHTGHRDAVLRYTAWSRPTPPPASPVAPLSPDEASELRACLDVGGLSPRALALARSLTDGLRDPWAKTQAILAWLARDHRYTTTLTHTDGHDPLDEFLFERRAGHCEYFASALALLLRAAGVPTRHVVGFHGGEWNEVGGYLVVRQRHAHAWVEVYLGAAGWVLVDPTPAAASSTTPRALGWRERGRQALDALGFAWERDVLGFDAAARRRLWDEVHDRVFGAGLTGLRGALRALDAHRGVGWALSGLALAALGAWRLCRRRRWRLSSAGAPAGEAVGEAGRWLERASRALERRGLRRAPGETMAALARRAVRLGDPGAQPFAELVACHDATRFGGLPSDARRLAELCAQVVRAVPSSDERSI